MVKPVVGSGRRIEAGKLGVYRRDFQAHATGTGFRHTANQIDMNPPIPAFYATQVQRTLELIAAGGGGGGASTYVSVGIEGTANEGDYNVTGSQTLEEALVLAFADPRVAGGGTVLIRSNSYVMETGLVEIPTGITVLGDPAGTVISAEIGNGALPPDETFIFRCTGGTATNFGNPGDPLLTWGTVATTTIANLTLADNLDGNVLGPTGEPTPTLSGFVHIDEGANGLVQGVAMLGRIDNDASLGSDWAMTLGGVAAGPQIPGPPGAVPTEARILNCYADGIAVFASSFAADGYEGSLTIAKCRVRTWATPGAFSAFVFVSAGTEATVEGNEHRYMVSDLGGTNYNINFLIGFPGVSLPGGRLAVTGNVGGSGQEGAFDPVALGLVFLTAEGYEGTVTSNAWGAMQNNGWYVTVGDGISSVGDVNGQGALQTVLQNYASLGLLSPTASLIAGATAEVRVLPGSHIVTGYGDHPAPVDLIGVSRPKQVSSEEIGAHPQVYLDLQSGGTDANGNLTLHVGARVENLTFISGLTFGGTSFQTVTLFSPVVAGDPYPLPGPQLHVGNCTFLDSGVAVNATQLLASNLTIEDVVCYASPQFNTNVFFQLDGAARSVVMRGIQCSPWADSGETPVYPRMHYFGFVTGLTGSTLSQSVLLEDINFTITPDPLQAPLPAMFNRTYVVPGFATASAAALVVYSGNVSFVTINTCRFAGTVTSSKIVTQEALDTDDAFFGAAWVQVVGASFAMNDCLFLAGYMQTTSELPYAALRALGAVDSAMDTVVCEGLLPAFIIKSTFPGIAATPVSLNSCSFRSVIPTSSTVEWPVLWIMGGVGTACSIQSCTCAFSGHSDASEMADSGVVLQLGSASHVTISDCTLFFIYFGTTGWPSNPPSQAQALRFEDTGGDSGAGLLTMSANNMVVSSRFSGPVDGILVEDAVSSIIGNTFKVESTNAGSSPDGFLIDGSAVDASSSIWASLDGNIIQGNSFQVSDRVLGFDLPTDASETAFRGSVTGNTFEAESAMSPDFILDPATHLGWLVRENMGPPQTMALSVGMTLRYVDGVAWGSATGYVFGTLPTNLTYTIAAATGAVEVQQVIDLAGVVGEGARITGLLASIGSIGGTPTGSATLELISSAQTLTDTSAYSSPTTLSVAPALYADQLDFRVASPNEPVLAVLTLDVGNSHISAGILLSVTTFVVSYTW